VVFTTRPFCQHLAGLGLALKKGLRGVELMNVRAAAFFLFTAAVALFVHPADTGDLAFFVHTSQKWLWDWFADPSVQVGPLQLLVFRVGDLAGVLALVVQLGTAALLWVTSGRLLAGRDPWIRFAVCVAAVVLGLTYGAYQDGHPAQVVVPLLWVLAGCDAREGRTVRAGALVGLSAGFEVWGLLGAVVFVLAPQPRAALRGVATEIGVAVALFLPFVLAGDFRMFEYHWQVNGDTLLGLVASPGTHFSWPMRMAQGLAALAAGAGVAWWLRRSLHAVWLAPLTVVAVRMALDPVRYPWYWLAVQTLVLLGAAELLARRLRFARKRHRRKLAAAR
jgi:hypothetical protein